jgi:hypothetical protein
VWLTANYFGGGLLMLVLFVCGRGAGQTGRLPRSLASGILAARMPWIPAIGIRMALAATGVFYVGLGIGFFVNASNAAPFWIDARTPLTPRLLSSPLIGLGLGMLLVSRASDWRMVAPGDWHDHHRTCGHLVFVALVLSRADFAHDLDRMAGRSDTRHSVFGRCYHSGIETGGRFNGLANSRLTAGASAYLSLLSGLASKRLHSFNSNKAVCSLRKSSRDRSATRPAAGTAARGA